MTMNLQGYMLADKDKILFMRGAECRSIAVTTEPQKQMPVFFKSAKHAQRCLEQIKNVRWTNSAKVYCKLYGLPTDNIGDLLRVTPCTIKVDF